MTYRTTCLATASALAMAAAGPVAAEVTGVAANGFELHETAHIAAAPDQVYAALLQPAKWWNSEHTFSGSAANLVLDARAGGCWCENLPGGGSVEHLHVVFVAPGKTLRLRGALGPLRVLGEAIERLKKSIEGAAAPGKAAPRG